MTRKLLLCDDEQHILRASQIKFSRAGFDVHTACDGQQAWDMIVGDDQPFDLLITDYQMPRLNGMQLIERLRQHEATVDLPIILLTAKGFELNEDELIRNLQISKLVAKPFSPRELLMSANLLLDGAPAPSLS